MTSSRDYVGEGAALRPPILVDHDLTFRNPRPRAGLAYWRSRCGGRAMPTRADLDPVDMREFLANVLLIEAAARSGGLDIRIRLAGTEIDAIFGPVTGKSPADFLPPDLAWRWTFMSEAVFAVRAPVRFLTRIQFKGQEFVTAELLGAPLSSDGTRIDMLFGVIAFTTDSEAPPGVP